MKKKTLENRQSFTRRLMQLLVLMAMLLAPKGAWAETLGYDLWVGGVQVTSDNYYNVVGDNIGGHADAERGYCDWIILKRWKPDSE